MFNFILIHFEIRIHFLLVKGPKNEVKKNKKREKNNQFEPTLWVYAIVRFCDFIYCGMHLKAYLYRV
ncbi:uncharacterized protein ASCRUDRAFT_98170 [Ascoidea rubescens DSM 1968]|uniref:Uncharacterized protein n=1 Tax=Ascoidea rubescens DSM 1968 TaxID=1344418 RepID=A0A1D2VQ31_9ASCO|nr:hypothetical protein ASCRUDRAFT_98170 [Ascoidea rubescens DSM 1968]ODV63706.1 hypothetical protein ASCRUDRAFT_98170 [Ascoidea rubescens DSM 1968]